MQTPNELLPDGLQMDLLWTNANINNSFGAQTISLDFSKYEKIMIISATYGKIIGTNMGYKNIDFDINGLFNGSTPNIRCCRTVNYNDNSITFGSGYADSNEHTFYAIPYKIYGIK